MLQEKKEKKKQEKEDEFITRYKNQVKSFKNNISEDLRLTNLITDKFCKNIYKERQKEMKKVHNFDEKEAKFIEKLMSK